MRRRHLHLAGAAFIGTAVVVFAVLAGGWKTKGHDADALWKLVHNHCAVDGKPCTIYDANAGYALLHDRVGRGQYLVIPTEKIPGIESPALLADDSPNYFARAWAHREYVSRAYGQPIPDDDLSLEINSVRGRTQNQLHIHIDCLQPEVKQVLDRLDHGIDGTWRNLGEPLFGHQYRAIRLLDLKTSPFKVLARDLQSPGDEMGRHTLLLVSSPNGFLLLDDYTHGLDVGSAEELQDHTCAGFVRPDMR